MHHEAPANFEQKEQIQKVFRGNLQVQSLASLNHPKKMQNFFANVLSVMNSSSLPTNDKTTPV